MVSFYKLYIQYIKPTIDTVYDISPGMVVTNSLIHQIHQTRYKYNYLIIVYQNEFAMRVMGIFVF